MNRKMKRRKQRHDKRLTNELYYHGLDLELPGIEIEIPGLEIELLGLDVSWLDELIQDEIIFI